MVSTMPKAVPESSHVVQAVSHLVDTDFVQIEPKKLQHPYLQSKQHIHIHQELLIRQRSGSMLDEKPELLRKLKERQVKLKDEEHKRYLERRRSSFELKLAEQARKILAYEEEEQRRKDLSTNAVPMSEFIKVHSKIVCKSMMDLSKSCST